MGTSTIVHYPWSEYMELECSRVGKKPRLAVMMILKRVGMVKNNMYLKLSLKWFKKKRGWKLS